jgi:hypothetical protein
MRREFEHVRLGSMLSKKSKVEWLRKSRKDQFLVVSAAVSLCRACAKVRDRFSVIRCGPSRCLTWDAPVGLKNFIRQPEKTFSTASVIRVDLTVGQPLPVYPDQRTFAEYVGTSQTCQQRKSPLHSITSSARPSSESGTMRPSAFAVLRFIISSTFVDCTTGRSAGFSPLRTFPA